MYVHVDTSGARLCPHVHEYNIFVDVSISTETTFSIYQEMVRRNVSVWYSTCACCIITIQEG